jgi:chorismate synthase
VKYGLQDFRLVRERASARETAARVAAGAMAKQLLWPFGTRVVSFVVSVGQIEATIGGGPTWPGRLGQADLEALAMRAEDDSMRCPDSAASEQMRAEVDGARASGETLGGVFCVAACGVPPGLGSYVQWDRRLDGRITQAVCSIPAVKGVQLGGAFEISRMRGTEAQDPIVIEEGEIVRTSNHAGGLEAGVTNGQPVVVLAAMKPLSSVRAQTPSVDFVTGAPADPPYVRSDVCAVPAAAVVGEAMVAWVLAAAMVERFGADRLDAMIDSCRSLGKAGLFGTAGLPVAPEEIP